MRRVLLALEGFLAVTAIAGGLGLLTGLVAPPVEDLAGSPFGSYLVPGVALAVVVGGLASAAFALTLRRHPWSPLASMVAGGAIIIFEVVEIAVIGSPAGPPRIMQGLYLVVGVLVSVIGALELVWARRLEKGDGLRVSQ